MGVDFLVRYGLAMGAGLALFFWSGVCVVFGLFVVVGGAKPTLLTADALVGADVAMSIGEMEFFLVGRAGGVGSEVCFLCSSVVFVILESLFGSLSVVGLVSW